MSDQAELVRQAMSIIGRARTEKKKESGQENAAKARKARWADPAARERHAAALRAAHDRRKKAKEQEAKAAEETASLSPAALASIARSIAAKAEKDAAPATENDRKAEEMDVPPD